MGEQSEGSALGSLAVELAMYPTTTHVAPKNVHQKYQETTSFEEKKNSKNNQNLKLASNPDGAVTHFQAELEGRVIKGTVKPHTQAEKDYNKAVANETTAFLGEETKADIFKIRVGFLKSGTQVKIILRYVTEVKNETGTNAIRFYIPTTIAPRYVSPSETDTSAKYIKDMDFSLTSPAPLSLMVSVYLQGGIKSIESPTHNVKVKNFGTVPEHELWHRAMVELAAHTTDMDRDFVLNIVPEETHKPRLYSEEGENGSTAVMLHLIPSFKVDEQKSELIFVLDRSGSMWGDRIDLARKALLLFLHSMPADCYFNVVGFGSTYQLLFANSVKYDDDSLKNAVAHAKALNADLGGTEILNPLKEIYGKSGIEGYLRQLFILTDGAVSNTDAVLGIVQANASKARVFALGIGDAASHYLVEGLAKAGGGTSAFVTYNESVDNKVLNQLKNGLQPSLTDIELEWEIISSVSEPKKPKSVLNHVKTLLGYKSVGPYPIDVKTWNKQAPKKIPVVKEGSQMLVFALFTDQQPKSVTIKAQSPDGPLTIKVENSAVRNDVGQMLGQMGVIHRLAAIKLIRELELEASALYFQELKNVNKQEKKLRNEIIEISCQSGITSKYTSFVAIDLKNNNSLSEHRMETRYVHSQVAHGWHGQKKRSVGWNLVSIGSSKLRLIASTNGLPSSERDTSYVPCMVMSPLLQLVSLQSFDGSYTLNDELAAILSKSLSEIKEGAMNLKLQDQIFATALAISFFITKISTERNSWELIVTKGRKWLAKTLQPQQVDDVISAATTFLGA